MPDFFPLVDQTCLNLISNLMTCPAISSGRTLAKAPLRAKVNGDRRYPTITELLVIFKRAP